VSECPDRYLIPVRDEFLYSAPLHGFAALVNRSAARLLRGGGPYAVRRVFGDTADEILRPRPCPRPAQGALAPSFLGLITTRGCNIACRYCDFRSSGKSRQGMSPTLAAQSVEWYAKRVVAQGGDALDIHFFGGEPFLAPQAVETAVHRARALAAELGLGVTFEAATNGVLEPAMREFAADYFTTIVLSLDGPAPFHDRARPGPRGQATYERVAETARYLGDSPVHLCIRICVTADSCPELPAICDWLCQTFAPDSLDFESLTPGPAAARVGLLPPPPIPFARALVASFRIASAHGVTPIYAATNTATPRLSFCPVGSDAIIVAPDGRVSACYLPAVDWQRRGLDLDFGTVGPDGLVIDSAGLARVRATPLGKPRCAGCFCRWLCAGGCHVNQTFPGAADAYTDFCRQTRVFAVSLMLEEMGLAQRTDALLADEQAVRRLARGDADEVLQWTSA
jgi:uncharacterized protein